MHNTNPYAIWNGQYGSNPQSEPSPSVFGALPFHCSPSNLNSFRFASSDSNTLNYYVEGQNSHVYCQIFTDPSMPNLTVLHKNGDEKPMSLVRWQQHPEVEFPGIVASQPVSRWLQLSADKSYREMEVDGQKYIWVSRKQTIFLHNATASSPMVLAKVSRVQDVPVLDISSSAIQAGLWEPCIVATFLFQCGRHID